MPLFVTVSSVPLILLVIPAASIAVKPALGIAPAFPRPCSPGAVPSGPIIPAACGRSLFPCLFLALPADRPPVSPRRPGLGHVPPAGLVHSPVLCDPLKVLALVPLRQHLAGERRVLREAQRHAARLVAVVAVVSALAAVVAAHGRGVLRRWVFADDVRAPQRQAGVVGVCVRVAELAVQPDLVLGAVLAEVPDLAALCAFLGFGAVACRVAVALATVVALSAVSISGKIIGKKTYNQNRTFCSFVAVATTVPTNHSNRIVLDPKVPPRTSLPTPLIQKTC